MRRIRVIPILLLKGGGLYKTIRFKKPNYIGDPINAVKIYNEKEVDELVILDIEATRLKKKPDFNHIRDIVSEAFMPLGYGGGIHTVDDIKRIIDCGIEKVIINTAAYQNTKIIEQGSKIFGSQSIVVAVDVKKDWLNREFAYVNNGKTRIHYTISDYIRKIQEYGAGEIVLTSIDREGTFSGYDTSVLKEVSDHCQIPIVANGGASNVEDFLDAVNAGASAVAAGSRFVYMGKKKGILINYPTQTELHEKLYSQL